VPWPPPGPFPAGRIRAASGSVLRDQIIEGPESGTWRVLPPARKTRAKLRPPEDGDEDLDRYTYWWPGCVGESLNEGARGPTAPRHTPMGPPGMRALGACSTGQGPSYKRPGRDLGRATCAMGGRC